MKIKPGYSLVPRSHTYKYTSNYLSVYSIKLLELFRAPK